MRELSHLSQCSYLCLFFFYLIALASISHTLLNDIGDSEHNGRQMDDFTYNVSAISLITIMQNPTWKNWSDIIKEYFTDIIVQLTGEANSSLRMVEH